MDSVHRELQLNARSVLKLGSIFLRFANPNDATIDYSTFYDKILKYDHHQFGKQNLISLFQFFCDISPTKIDTNNINTKSGNKEKQENQETLDDEKENMDDDDNNNEIMDKDKMTFVQFLVIAAICTQTEFLFEACLVFFCLTLSEGNDLRVANKAMILETIEWFEQTSDKPLNQFVYQKDMDQFFDNVFSVNSPSLSKEAFCKASLNYGGFVQSFLQYAILARFGVKTSRNPFNNDIVIVDIN